MRDVKVSEELMDNALLIVQEAVGYIRELKASKAYSVLHAEDGSFIEALDSPDVTQSDKEYLHGLRSAICVGLA
jgi:hypothetical protein